MIVIASGAEVLKIEDAIDVLAQARFTSSI
jgi:hypothetical protein